MSLQALNWAFGLEAIPSSHKFVLVALANYASETGKAYPSVPTICRLTCQQDATVRRALDSLVTDGVIFDSGKKTGATQQIKVYQLPQEACERPTNLPLLKTDGKTPERPTNSYSRPITPEQEQTTQQVVEWWNSKPSLKKVKSLSSGRRGHLLKRLKDPFWAGNFKQAIDDISVLPFCLGKNDRGWVATFDWFVRPDTLVKIVEGFYGRGTVVKPGALEKSNSERFLNRWPTDKPPRREQFDNDQAFESHLEAFNKWKAKKESTK